MGKNSPNKRKLSVGSVNKEKNFNKPPRKSLPVKLQPEENDDLKSEESTEEIINVNGNSKSPQVTRGKSPQAKKSPQNSSQKRKAPVSAEKDAESDPEKSFSSEQADDSPAKKKKKSDDQEDDPEIAARTVYVGNVPIAADKDKLSKFFSKFGEVESVRLRGAAPSDPKLTKKVAVIKKKLHDDRKSQIAYVKFVTKESAVKALNANGAVFQNHHLRVTISNEKPKQDENKAIFIGNLSFQAEEEDIWAIFQKCGPIDNIRLLRDSRTGIGKGFGYVNFKSADAVQIALEMEPVVYKEREIRVKHCNQAAAKKNTNKPFKKEITKPGKPKKKGKQNKAAENKEAVKNESEDEVSDSEDVPVKDVPPAAKKLGNFQGVKSFEGKKKKFNKGDLQKKKLAKKLAGKPKGQKA